MGDMTSWNDNVIAEFRESIGTTNHWGPRLIIIHAIGAKSGEERLSPVLGLRKGDGWLVTASAGGAPKHPAWYFNLKAHPDVTIEAIVDGSIQKVDVTAAEVDDADYDADWAPFVEASAQFDDYKKTTEGRRMPVLLLTPRKDA
jgi:deazaflavin-dependent oxidoreductase (nitroreductase family)